MWKLQSWQKTRLTDSLILRWLALWRKHWSTLWSDA
jgi:hypothetical protein